MPTSKDNHGRDVFLCHAHADKADYVEPLAAVLQDYGITCWLDRAEIGVGDYIAEKINEGLRHSRFVLVFVTSTFLERNWPIAELHAAFGMEVRRGEVVVLPILAIPASEWENRYPLLSGKLFLEWAQGVDAIAEEVAKKIGAVFQEKWLHHYQAGYNGTIWIRVLTFGQRRGTRHTIYLRWGPWRCKRTFKSEMPAVCLVQTKAVDEFSVPLFVEVRPPAHVTFGTGDPPCTVTLYTNHKWWRIPFLT